MDQKEKITFSILTAFILIGAIFNSYLLWDGSRKISSLEAVIDNSLPNLENFADEIDQLIKKQNKVLAQSSDKNLEFLDTPYCASVGEGNLSVISIQKDLSANIWDIKKGGYSEYLKRDPDFRARLYFGFGGLSIQFTDEDSSYFPKNYSFSENGKVLSFFISNSFYSSCIPLNNR